MGDPRIWTAKEAETLRKAATPGPWRLFRDRGFGQWVVAQKRVECGWSGVVTEYNFRRADGRMIAAAPDLAASVAHHARRADAAEAMIRRIRWQRDKAARWAGVDLAELDEAADDAGFCVEVSGG